MFNGLVNSDWAINSSSFMLSLLAVNDPDFDLFSTLICYKDIQINVTVYFTF